MNSKYEQMWENLSDQDFRKQFIDEHVDVGIAFQIRSLRNRQELTQSELAKLLDVKQPLLSSWENPNYGKYTLGTLKDLAKAFDVGLLVRFVPFSTLVDWTINLTSDVIAPPNFGEEQSLIPALIPDSGKSDLENLKQMKGTKDMDVYDADILIPASSITSTTTVRELINA